jgi:hypothetical protein
MEVLPIQCPVQFYKHQFIVGYFMQTKKLKNLAVFDEIKCCDKQ